MGVSIEDLSAGLEIMRRPVLPLAKMTQLLYLTGPFETISDLLGELNEPIETLGITYENPGSYLQKHINSLSIIETLKNPRPPMARVFDENHDPLDPMEALELLMTQQILTMELEEINSLLCQPCGCSLCCIGPDNSLAQEFFEIPLSENETALFNLPKIDTDASRSSFSSDIPPFSNAGVPFYTGESSIIHWQTGWSMILLRNKSCPSLDSTTGGCTTYLNRPEVCRRPQIFTYALEHEPELDIEYENRVLPTYIRRNKLLAIWDCPYVKTLKDEIAQYAELCGLEPVFKENKT